MRKVATIIALLMLGIGTTLAQDSSQVQVAAPEIYQRAGQAFEAQDYPKAITDYSLFILLNPTFSSAYYERGQSYIQLNDLESALSDFTRALELPSPSPEFTAGVYWIRSAILLEQNKADDALADLDQAIVIAPQEPESYFRRGQIYASQERYQEALEDFNQGIQLAPNVPNLYELRGQVHQQLENYDAALADFSRAIELDPNNAGVYSARAAVHDQQEQLDTALQDLDIAIQLQPDSLGLYLQRGALHNRLGNQELAAADYFQWMVNTASDETSGLELRPGESLVVQMRQGQIYSLAFEGRAGQTISVSATARVDQSTDPLLLIIDPNQKPLAADDDGGGAFNATIQDFTVPQDGVYLIVVGHAGGNADGAIRVLLTVNP